MTSSPRSPNRPAKVYIAMVAAAGTLMVAIRLTATRSWTLPDVLAWAVLAAAIALTELFPIHVRYRTETLNLSLTEALWVGALILGRPGVLALAIAAGVLLAQILRRRPLYKVAFNTGQFVLAVSVATAIFELFQRAAPSDPRAWVATAVAMAGYGIVNFGLVGLIIALMECKPLVDVIRRPLLVNVVHFAGNTAIGLAGAVIWKANPAGLLLLFFPMGLMYVAYRTLTRSLRDGETIRELIVQNASDGIFVVSPQGATLSWNPAMERITGFAENEAVGRDWRDVLGATAWHGNAAAATEPEGMLLFAPVRRRDGSERWVRYATNPLAGPESKGHATVVVMHDATAEYEAERLKSDFIASISHELRTPLTPLKGFLQMLISGTTENTEEARQEYYRIMLRQAMRLETLVNQLLDLSRLETDGPAVEDGPVDLVALASEHVRAFSEQQPHRRIHLRATDRPLVVRGDARSIGLILSNLMSNAIKYSSPETVVTIEISTTEECAVISVRDHGGGIADGDQPRVFERFFQGRNRRIGDGVGLGLHIAKRLVEAGGGDIWFESSLEEGSTFHFSLPLPSGNGAPATSNGSVLETPQAEASAHRVEA